jgi:hypothetical protein
MRLIDADALRKRMFSYYKCVNENSSKEYYRGETLMNYEVADLIEDCIDEAPTVDAVELVHGRWEDVSLRFTQVKEKCTVCGGIVYAHGFNYCPHCGAKMDGERKDNDET